MGERIPSKDEVAHLDAELEARVERRKHTNEAIEISQFVNGKTGLFATEAALVMVETDELVEAFNEAIENDAVLRKKLPG